MRTQGLDEVIGGGKSVLYPIRRIAMLLGDLLDILFEFGGGKGGEPNNVAVRFLLPSVFWGVLAFIALRQWRQRRSRKDLYLGLAALLGLSRELTMFVAEYGSLRGHIPFDAIYPVYPPFEHGATMLSCVMIGFAYLNNLQGDRSTRLFLSIGSAITGILTITTAYAWPAFLATHPNAPFASFWGDLAFRVSGSILMLSVLVMLARIERKQPARTPATLFLPFLFFFLDDFLMIFNILTGERFVGLYAPIRHNLHIWAIPMLVGAYWSELVQSLSDAEKRVSSIFRVSPSALCVADCSGTITVASPASFQVLGCPPEELIGKDLRRLGEGPELPLATPGSGQQPMSFICQHTEENGTTKWLNWNIRWEEKEELLYAVISDITEHKKLEAQLRQAQKLEAVGTLAGGIAHDFNNMLTTIVGYTTLLQMKMAEDSPDRVMVDHILAASERAANLTKSLLAYSRKQINDPAAVNLNTVVRGIEKLLTRLIPETIEFTCSCGEKDLTVWADSGQIEQLIMNLVTNARDAMPTGGKLIISAEPVELEDEFVQSRGQMKAGSYALLSVADSGTGMDEKTRERIFEPFFTTKDVGKGSGLGLSMVYGIVKQHDGFIDVISEPGRGTTFRIYLPIVDIAMHEAEPKEVRQPKGGTETILLIEDESEVRQLLKDVLDGNGYHVIEAADGVDGVRKFLKHRQEIHLVVTDVMMPRKNGKEAFDEIRRAREDIKAIFISGYSAVTTRLLLDEGLPYLQKPVSPQELLFKTREVLDAE
jgi:PAS domain S-box-containing protein